MALQSLIIPIVTLLRSGGLTQARAAMGSLGKTFDSFSKNVGAAAASFAGFQAIAGSREFILESIDATQRLERNLIALGQVYDNLTPQLKRFGESVSDYGISQNQAAQASIFIGSVLKQYGFNVADAADATQRIVKLSQDLATTYGYDVQEALLAVTALFRGEFDPIEKFGVAMKQNEINAELAARGLGHLEGAARENAEAQITLDFLFTRAADSVGAFARATDTLYASQKRLQAQIQNLQAEFGEPFQKPLANINNILAEIVEDSGPGLVEVSDKIGEGITAVTPFIEKLAYHFIQLAQLSQHLVEILTALVDIIRPLILPVIDAFNKATEILINTLDALSATTTAAIKILRDFADNNPVFKFVADAVGFLGAGIFGKLNAFIDGFNESVQRARDNARGFTGDIQGFDDGVKQASVALRGKALATRDDEKAAAAAAAQTEALAESLRELAGETRDAEGNLTGLAKLFADIDEAAAKSEAKEALEAIGLEASMIEEILTEPNWQQIFGDIARYARLAALDINTLSMGAAAFVTNTMLEIQKGLPDLFGEVSAGGAVTDFIGDFFDNIDNEIAKETARRKLQKMGASEGLIEAIVGAAGWEEVFKRVISEGVEGLERLQEEFNKTRAGIEEVTAATEAFEAAQKKALDAARKEAEAFIAEQQRKADEAEAAYKRARAAADDFLERLEDFAFIEILPNVEADIGRFEAAVIGSVERIRSELKSAFRSELIYKEDFDAISAFVAAEEFELRRLAQVRDDLATRYTLSEALINDYKRALTGALQLSQIFNSLKTETEKRTVTETQRGIAKLGDSLREFEVVVTRSYEETIEKVQDKTAGLLDGFRDMAQKSRDFAANLQKLRALGLDPMLFDQLVQAGVIAGGETAQALVDGGEETIAEINGLFQEINQLGADLGEEIATTMYGAGIDLTNGLLEGIKSQQEAMLELARSMAEAFSAEFNSRINIAIEKPVAAAKKIADDAAAAVPKIEDIDIAGLAQLNAYLENAGTALAKVKTDVVKAGISTKIAAVEELKKDILAGAKFDLSGIEKGLTSAELVGRVEALRGTTPVVVNNTYNIQPGNKLEQAQTLELLKSTTDKNGSLAAYGIQS